MPSGMVVMLICMPFLDVALMLRNGCPCMVCISYRMMSACLVRIGSTSVVPSLGSREGDACSRSVTVSCRGSLSLPYRFMAVMAKCSAGSTCLRCSERPV